MMVTASRIPVPDPIAPRKSASTERAPMQRPPNAAAVGMYLAKTHTIEGRGERENSGQTKILKRHHQHLQAPLNEPEPMERHVPYQDQGMKASRCSSG